MKRLASLTTRTEDSEWTRAHRCMLCCHSHRSHEETSISYNKKPRIQSEQEWMNCTQRTLKPWKKQT
jgi:hypothetical protein